MIKKLFNCIISLIVLASMISCNKKPSNDANELDYMDFFSLHIVAENMYLQEESEYLVYIYSHSCLHCERIKKDVINFCSNSNYPLYFLEYTEQIKLGDFDQNFLGAKSLEETYILGTPALLQIKNKTLTIDVSGDELVLAILREFYT